MQVKDSLKNIWKIIQEHFAIPFCASVFFVALGIYIFKLQFYLFSLETILYTGLTSGFVAFFLWFKKLEKKSKHRKFIMEFLRSLFLTSLITLTFSKNLSLILVITSIFSGLIIFRERQLQTETEIKNDKIYPSDITLKKYFISKFNKRIVNKKMLFYLILLAILTNYILTTNNNLSLLPLQNDEFLTQNAVEYIYNGYFKASDILSGADTLANNNFYSRAIPYSLFSTLVVKLTGNDVMSISSLRYSSVLLGILSLILLIIFTKNINKTFRIFYLLAISNFYLFVYHSRSARMYSLVFLIFFTLLLLQFTLYQKFLEDYNKNSSQNILYHLKKRYFLYLLTCFVTIIGIQTHFNILYSFIAFYFYLVIESFREKVIRRPLIILTILGIFAAFINFKFVHIIQSWYLNIYKEVYTQFYQYNFEWLRGKYFTLIFFLFTALHYNKLPNYIKIALIGSISITGMFVFVINGKTFHDPRYMIFEFPLYIATVLYGIDLSVKAITQNNISKFILYVVLYLCFINPISLIGICKNNFLTECPISDKTKVFNLDRWNYDFDTIHKIIQSNINDNTIIISRSIYNFYMKKYNIKNQYIRMTTSNDTPNYTINDIRDKEILFILYPQLIYREEAKPYSELYNYLYNNTNKQLLYKSNDGKAVIFKIPPSSSSQKLKN